MCCGGGYFVNQNVLGLEVGDGVMVNAGAGMPPSEVDMLDIIHVVSGGSYLTAGGIRLSCFDHSRITPTGVHYDSYVVSPEAQAILDGQAAFNSFEVGDEVVIEPGFYIPYTSSSFDDESEDDETPQTDIIAVVDRSEGDGVTYYTAKGRMIFTRHWEGVKKTGTNYVGFDVDPEIESMMQ